MKNTYFAILLLLVCSAFPVVLCVMKHKQFHAASAIAHRDSAYDTCGCPLTLDSFGERYSHKQWRTTFEQAWHSPDPVYAYWHTTGGDSCGCPAGSYWQWGDDFDYDIIPNGCYTDSAYVYAQSWLSLRELRWNRANPGRLKRKQ